MPAGDKRTGSFSAASWTDEDMANMMSYRIFWTIASKNSSLGWAPSLAALPPPLSGLHKWISSFSLLLEYICVYACDAQLRPTLCDPMNCSLPGSSVHGISQARILEWVAISYSRGSS